MLIMFKVKNYTSFREEAILDMRAAAYRQHPTHLLETENGIKLVKTVAIYGANASGKSNFISAMYFFEEYIFEQFITKKTVKDSDFFERGRNVRLEPFQLSEKNEEPSEFDIIFTHNGRMIQYGFSCTAKRVVSEWYYIDDKKVFEREGKKVTYGKVYEKYIRAFSHIPEERLYLSVLEYFLGEEEKKLILADFIEFFRKDYDVFLEVLFESTVKRIVGAIRINRKILEDKQFRERVEMYLRQIDVGIRGLIVREKLIADEKTGEEKNRKILKTIHDVYDADGNVCGQREFELLQESTGTIRFLTYIQEIAEMTERGGVLVVDEISARLHPLLTKLLIDIFQDSENTKAQLIFTTHDISLLNKEQFRRDEVVFVDKNERGESSLYALSDLRVRDDATFHKDYLQGKYGAIPILDYDDILGGDKDGKNKAVF